MICGENLETKLFNTESAELHLQTFICMLSIKDKTYFYSFLFHSLLFLHPGEGVVLSQEQMPVP